MNTQRPARHLPAIVIGGGQAGLSASYLLKSNGIDHLVFERHRIAHAWRTQRWDSFCLVTPNWQCQLPGFGYSGADPFGFMPCAEIVDYIEGYADAFGPPLREGVAVQRVARHGGVFALHTSDGDYTAENVIVAISGYHVPRKPAVADRFHPSLLQLHSSQYKNPAQLPQGAVLVVGTGQSGCQIAEDLHLAGRRVHLCTGSAPRVSRRYRGRDVVEWLNDMGHYDIPVEDHPQGAQVRAKSNHYVTGRDGGRDIDLRRFALEGMQLHGRLRGISDGTLLLGDDLAKNLDRADASAEAIKDQIDGWIEARNLAVPAEPRYVPVWQPENRPAEISMEDEEISAIVWATGFHSDFTWIDMDVFEPSGYPQHVRGITPQPGLYFLGLPWLHSWGSGRFSGVARDADYIVADITRNRALVSAA